MDLLKLAVIRKLLDQEKLDWWKTSPKKPSYEGQIDTKGAPPVPKGYSPNIVESEGQGTGASYADTY